MKILLGKISSGGYGVAARNLAPVIHLICRRMGFPTIVPGTLNINLTEPYFVKADATITKDEYKINNETILLQRCRIKGIHGIIMRPDSHETGFAHGPAHLEIMSRHHLRSVLHLSDGDPISVEVEGDQEWWKKTGNSLTTG